MNKELCNILKSKLEDLPVVDVLAGMAQTLTQNRTTGGDQVNTTTTLRYPVSDDTNQDPAIFGREIDLSPDENRRAIVFFEDYGISALQGRNEFQSSVRLLVWLNRQKLAAPSTYDMISGKTMANILERLISRNPENIGMFTRLVVSLARIPPQDPALFGRYTFDETRRQYLRPPFEFFGIDLTAKYFIKKDCLI